MTFPRSAGRERLFRESHSSQTSAAASGIIGRMDADTRQLTNRHAAVAAVVSFVAQPIPAADELVVIPIHYLLAGKLIRRRQIPLGKVPWRPLNKIIWGGAAARLVVNFTLGLVPVAGAFSNAFTAIALTEALARYLDAAFADPDAAPPDVSLAEMRAAIEATFREGFQA
jgi:uncharacterized protein (DUF697 family)